MNTGRQNTCDKIRGTLRYIDFHLSKTFHVEVIDSLKLKPRTQENRRKWKKWKKRDMSIHFQNYTLQNFDPAFFEDDVVITGDRS